VTDEGDDAIELGAETRGESDGDEAAVSDVGRDDRPLAVEPTDEPLTLRRLKKLPKNELEGVAATLAAEDGPDPFTNQKYL